MKKYKVINGICFSSFSVMHAKRLQGFIFECTKCGIGCYCRDFTGKYSNLNDISWSIVNNIRVGRI